MGRPRKPCRKCGGPKAPGDAHYCRNCPAPSAGENQKKWSERNPDKRRASLARYVRENPVQIMLTQAKYRARKRGIPFDLTVADVSVPEFCPILGIRLQAASGRHGPEDGSPSIDRIDNAKGYLPDNIIIVSNRANRLKGDATLAELRSVADFYESLIVRKRTASRDASVAAS